MHTIARRWLGQSLVLAAAASPLAGCGEESPLGPTPPSAPPVAAPAATGSAHAGPELGACGDLRPPAGSKFLYHVYAEGFQIYRWDGGSWIFVGPSATLFADAGGKATVGTHYSGPTWQSLSGGAVIGAVSQRCPVDPADIPWLLLDVVSNDGPGVFQNAASIQRVNTVGGQFPTEPGSVTNELKHVPYTAEYFFYRAP
jgi:hypothetical protein